MLQVSLKLLQQIIKSNRIALSFIAGGLFLYFATPTLTTLLSGVPVMLLGELIRTWASGFIKKDEALAQEGPYALSRNPLYLGNFFIGLGFSIMAGNLMLLVFFLIIFTLIYNVTIRNEEEKLIDKFGDIFLEYKRRVPVFFPIPAFLKSPLSPPLKRRFEGGFALDWRLIIQHREHHTWLGIVGCIIIFIVKLTYFNVK